MTPKESLELFAELRRTEDPAIRNRLVEEHTKLAAFFARRYKDRGVEPEDLRQVANMALVKAVDRFDPELGVRFSTFAGRTIDGELKRYFRDTTWSMRVPRSLKERSQLVRRTVDEMRTQLGRTPTADDIAERLGLEPEDVVEALEVSASYNTGSLDAQVGGDADGDTLGTLLGGDDPGFGRSETRMALAALIENLPPRERQIIGLRFFSDMTQTEIAEQVGVSQMQVSRLLRKTLAELKEGLTD